MRSTLHRFFRRHLFYKLFYVNINFSVLDASDDVDDDREPQSLEKGKSFNSESEESSGDDEFEIFTKTDSHSKSKKRKKSYPKRVVIVKDENGVICRPEDMRIPRQRKCRLCKRRIQRDVEMIEHFTKNHPEEKPFKCSLASCPFTTNGFSEVKKHIIRMHPYEEIKQFWDHQTY
jgi:hypothetical protein